VVAVNSRFFVPDLCRVRALFMLLVTSEQLTPLQRALELCQRYLDIGASRLRDRLQLQWRIADGLRNQAIPSLTLQPLVENAIYRGIQARGQALFGIRLVQALRCNVSGHRILVLRDGFGELPVSRQPDRP